MLLSSILCNSEVLYGLKKAHIDKLESVDKYFWKKIFECPFSTPTEAFYLETNTIPIRFVLVSRRLMYFWNILQMDESELVKKVYNIQKLFHCKNDWVEQILEDLEMCDIKETETEIKAMTKYAFRKLVKERIKKISCRGYKTHVFC